MNTTQKKSKRPTKTTNKASRRRRDTEPVPDVTDVLVDTSARAQPAPPVKRKSTKVKKTKERKEPSSTPSSTPSSSSRRRPIEPESEPIPPPSDLPMPSTSRRSKLSREELESYFDNVVASLEEELASVRTDKSYRMGVKKLRSVVKDVKRLKTSSLKSMKKTKTRNANSSNVASGFMKKVPVSREMSDFAGWNPSDLHSRVDVTKYVCNYVKERELQNPEDKREIVADDRLRSLLRYDRETDGEPLTYFYLQKKIQHLFPKGESRD